MGQDTWAGCYASGWQGVCVPEAFAHPAKYSKSLIFKIIQHAIDEGFVTKGATVFDPFAGVSLGSLPCNLLGLHWCGIELEEKFWQLSQNNIALWKTRYGTMPGYGTAVCLQGDSRDLLSVLHAADMICSSPPYASNGCEKLGKIDWSKTHHGSRAAAYGAGACSYAEGNPEGYGTTEGNLGNLPPGAAPPVLCVSSPVYPGCVHDRNGIDQAKFSGSPGGAHSQAKAKGYGQTPGNLGNLPIGAIVTSPPFATSTQANHNPADMTAGKAAWKNGTDSGARVKQDYAPLETPGNLANMVVSSPPYEASLNNAQSGKGIDFSKTKRDGDVSHQLHGNNGVIGGMFYGETDGQLGTTQGSTFWSAAAQIISQCFQLLPVGGHAIFVVKSYIAKGAIVNFPEQWAALCNSVGLRVIHEHHALLTTDHGTELNLFGGETKRQTKRRSFFRALYENRHPDNSIDHETVLCFRKDV